MRKPLEARGRGTIKWTAGLIKPLRGRRSQTEFGLLVGAKANTIWRWEDGRAGPDDAHARRLDQLAEMSVSSQTGNFAGSITLRGDCLHRGSRL
jgi:hypothetical protein